MLPSIDKLLKFIKLEAGRGFDNRAVMGGLEKILPMWESQARIDRIPEESIRKIRGLISGYAAEVNNRQNILREICTEISEAAGEPPGKFAAIITTGNQPSRKENPKPAASARTGRSQSVSSAPAAGQQTGRNIPQVRLGLSAPLTVIQGIGPRYAETLSKLGLHSLEDLLFYFPRRYDDFSQLKTIGQLFFGEEVTVIGNIKYVTSRPMRRNRFTITEAILSDTTGDLRLNWFNQKWLATRLQPGMPVVVSGKVEQYLGRLVINNPEWEPLDREQLNTNRIVPVYPLTATITQRWLRRIMYETVSYWSGRVEDFLPQEIKESCSLPQLSEALREVHFPSNADSLQNARKRLAFDEIFLLQLGVLRQKQAWHDCTGRVFKVEDAWLEQQVAKLPYSLTAAQHRVLADFRRDLAGGSPMNRLLQGDVGSGKTIVAALTAAIIASAGSQSALMAPTSILAEQHFRNLSRLLADPADPAALLRPEQVVLLVGDTGTAERRSILAGLSSGEIKLVIGTHALIEDPVQFNDLQFVVIDEQHRFGVGQRSLLRSKGTNPHLLVMTATPIPRSLALTIYGDLDLSVMDEMPAGRQKIETEIYFPGERETVYNRIRSQVENGFQVFIIYPLVEQGENEESMAAVDEHTRLSREVFSGLKLGLLHGRMKPEDKDKAMRAFRDRELDIMVSTSVVEVGVDIPNATMIVIEGANRFGLSQLHQFRGRVGRGSAKSYCILIPDSDNAVDNQRLQAMVQTSDGFVLAEKDLDQRGPGDFLGTRQSGFSDLRMASLTDVKMIEMARNAAQQLYSQDPNLSSPENQYLASTMHHFWGDGKGDVS